MFEEIINNKIGQINSTIHCCDHLNLPLVSKELTIEKLLEIDTNLFVEYFAERYNNSTEPKVYLIPVQTKWSNLNPMIEHFGKKKQVDDFEDKSKFEISNEKKLPVRYIYFTAKYFVKHASLGSIYTINPNVSKFIVSTEIPIDQ